MIERNPSRVAEESEPWIDQIRQQLDDSARDLDAATLSRLNQARQQAMLQWRSPVRRVWPWLMLATSVAFAWMAWLGPAANLIPAPTTPMALERVEDFELLTEEDGLALYSDLEFYAWLDSQEAGS